MSRKQGWISKIAKMERIYNNFARTHIDDEHIDRMVDEAGNWGSCAVGQALFGAGHEPVGTDRNVAILRAVDKHAPAAYTSGQLFTQAIFDAEWDRARSIFDGIQKYMTAERRAAVLAAAPVRY